MYAQYFKMLRLGVPKPVLQMKMKAEGVDPSVIDMDPMAPSPNGGAADSTALISVDSDSEESV